MNLEAHDIGVAISQRPLFAGVNIQCRPGTILALTGASGCGKTTLLGCLGLLVKPSMGTIELDGTPLRFSERSRASFWRKYASFVYQDYGIIDEESVGFNVSLHGSSRAIQKNQRINELLTTVGLAGRAREPAAVLSGGEKQRVGIARALYKNAHFIFADEPTASLNADNRRLVIELLRTAANEGAAVIIATHDDNLAASADAVFDLPEHGRHLEASTIPTQ